MNKFLHKINFEMPFLGNKRTQPNKMLTFVNTHHFTSVMFKASRPFLKQVSSLILTPTV